MAQRLILHIVNRDSSEMGAIRSYEDVLVIFNPGSVLVRLKPALNCLGL